MTRGICGRKCRVTIERVKRKSLATTDEELQHAIAATPFRVMKDSSRRYHQKAPKQAQYTQHPFTTTSWPQRSFSQPSIIRSFLARPLHALLGEKQAGHS